MLRIGDFSRLSQVSIKALRYYDARGLLAPAHIDPETNYRYYSTSQLPRLNRILALKDLGLSLEQIGDLLTEGPPSDQITALLETRRAAIAEQIAEEQARLARVEARLRQIQQEGKLPEFEVIVKPVEAQRIVAARDRVPTYGAIDGLCDRVFGYLGAKRIDPASAYPALSLYHDQGYVEEDPDVTFALTLPTTAPHNLPAAEGVNVLTLPAVPMMACVIHRGPYRDFAPAYTALMQYIADNQLCIQGPNRQVYLTSMFEAPNDPSAWITEIQFPVAPAR